MTSTRTTSSYFHHESYEAHKRRIRKRNVDLQERSGFTRLFCALYCMVMCVFGTVFPISDALSKVDGVHTYYTEIFHTYLYSCSVGILSYFFLFLLRRRVNNHPGPEVNLRSISNQDRPQIVPSGAYIEDRGGNENPNLTASQSTFERADPSKFERELRNNELQVELPNNISQLSIGRSSPHPFCNESSDWSERSLSKEGIGLSASGSLCEKLPIHLRGVTFDSDGLNFYLRLGALGFGLGSMVHSGFRISEPFEDKYAFQCRSVLFIANAVLYLVFVFLQTFYIFKYHKVVINQHKPFVRICLVHLMTTNLAVWLSTTVHETMEDIGRVYANERFREGMNRTVTIAPPTYSFDPNDSSVYHSQTGVEEIRPRSCHEAHTLSDRSAPYLFPCMIEYSLIAAAVAYKTFKNVGRRTTARVEPRVKHADVDVEQHECHKSNLGLFAGLLMILLTFLSIALFFVFQDFKNLKEVASVIFLVSEIFLFLLGIGVSIFGICRIKRLHYTGPKEGDFDDKLLLVSLFGVYLLSTCVALSSGSGLMAWQAIGHQNHGAMICALFLVMALLNFIESTVQTVFILDGLHRSAGRHSDVENKPGRSVITFLLVCNLAMWMINTFEMKKSKGAAVHVHFYNYLPWSIIMHLCLPLVILFRFHSSVCLSEVWNNAYTFKEA